MKKVISIIVLVFVMVSSLTCFAANTEIIVNGEKATIAEGMGSIVEKDSRTFVPVRFLLEYLDFDVSWEERTQTVVARHQNGESFFAQVGNNRLFYFDAKGNQKDINEMDTAPFLNYSEARTYVPIRFIAEAIGYTVGFDDATKTVTLTK